MLINKEKIIYLTSQKALDVCKILADDLSIKPSALVSILKFFKELDYILITATAIDLPQKTNRFLLQYVCIAYNKAQRVYLNINTPLKAVSIIDMFPSAIWLEREIYDLFGVFFYNTKLTNDLRRILTDYNFKGHPLRKDFALIGYNEKVYSYFTKSIKNKKEVIF